MSKPVALVVANRVHTIQGMIAQLRPEQLRAFEANAQRVPALEEQLRQILCDIAHEATLAVVVKALAAAGAPSSVAELDQMLQAARDQMMREEARPAQGAAS